MDLAVAIGALVVSLLALALGVVNAVQASKQRETLAGAAVTEDLYPVVRRIRAELWEIASPSTPRPETLDALRKDLEEASDLVEAIHDPELREVMLDILLHDAATVVLGADPHGILRSELSTDAVETFAHAADLAQGAVDRCQRLRRGVR